MSDTPVLLDAEVFHCLQARTRRDLIFVNEAGNYIVGQSRDNSQSRKQLLHMIGRDPSCSQVRCKCRPDTAKNRAADQLNQFLVEETFQQFLTTPGYST